MKPSRSMHASVTLLVVGMAILALSAGGAVAGGPTARESLVRLKAGNGRFVANPADALPIDAARRTALAEGQSPFATILSCADSRVPPEIIFHTGLGDLFVVRAAGNITDRAILASVEYAAEHLHVPLVVVMGHESCGAVKAAVETPESKSLGVNLDYLLKAIRPSVSATAAAPAATRMRAAILQNVEETLNDLIEQSPMLNELGHAGTIGFVGAYYELASGRVSFSEPVALSGVVAAKGHER
jgi:carbonic anhydrase